MALADPKLHFRFAALQSLTDVRAGVTLGGGAASYDASLGLAFAGNGRVLDDVTWYSGTQGTFFIRVTMTNTGAQMFFLDAFTDSDDGVRIGTTATPTTANYFVQRSGGTQAQLTRASSLAAGVESKIAVSYVQNSFAGFIDGNTMGTDVSGNVPNPSAVDLYLGANGVGTLPLTGHIAEVAYWDTVQSAADIEALSNGSATVPLQSGSSGIGFMSKFGFR